MELLEALKFTKGAISSKDFIPALTHFRIADKTIKSFNGNLSLSCPIQLDIEASPKAIPFIKAIQACKETTAIHMTAAGRLGIKSGKFTSFIECMPTAFPDVYPEGERIDLNGDLLPALKLLKPFIAEDASRPWARGILFKAESAFATNNICLIEHWLGYTFPAEINIPQGAVKELLRIGEEPEYMQIGEGSVTFHFSENKWLRSNLLDLQWPDISRLLSQESNPVPINNEFFEAVEELSPFVDDLGRIFITPDQITTSLVEGIGADMQVSITAEEGCYHNKQLLLLRTIADSFDFMKYPSACPFYGDNIRGVIIGMRI